MTAIEILQQKLEDYYNRYDRYKLVHHNIVNLLLDNEWNAAVTPAEMSLVMKRYNEIKDLVEDCLNQISNTKHNLKRLRDGEDVRKIVYDVLQG